MPMLLAVIDWGDRNGALVSDDKMWVLADWDTVVDTREKKSGDEVAERLVFISAMAKLYTCRCSPADEAFFTACYCMQ